MEICGVYLETWGHSNMFRSVVQVSFWVKAELTPSESFIFEDAEGNEWRRKEEMIVRAKHWFVYVSDRRTINLNSGLKIIYKVSIVDLAVYIRRKSWDAGGILSNASFPVYVPINQRLSSNENLTIGFSKPSFSKSLFNLNHTACASGWRPQRELFSTFVWELDCLLELVC